MMQDPAKGLNAFFEIIFSRIRIDFILYILKIC